MLPESFKHWKKGTWRWHGCLGPCNLVEQDWMDDWSIYWLAQMLNGLFIPRIDTRRAGTCRIRRYDLPFSFDRLVLQGSVLPIRYPKFHVFLSKLFIFRVRDDAPLTVLLFLLFTNSASMFWAQRGSHVHSARWSFSVLKLFLEHFVTRWERKGILLASFGYEHIREEAAGYDVISYSETRIQES